MKDKNRNSLSVGDLVFVPYHGIGLLVSIHEGQAEMQMVGCSGVRVRRHPSDLELIHAGR